ncbi:hypothetical protein AB433_07390 [Croceicoccus naphthovorans]|uniref:Uncharacterized protein n=1 Tax=Croceicoccus naphthovorans TaxID=1348774 RepID=A0A0G3XGT1_9SPHN|nr:hypothetical protein [Croceicoccus naphthovorans]AKM09846.1 hypothetical protein AB433_07390 [Croceicoccus naphthovorans]
MVRFHDPCDAVGRQQFPFHSGQHAAFQCRVVHRAPIGASALPSGVGAAPFPVGDDRHVAAALTAGDQARQQLARAVLSLEIPVLPLCLAFAHRFPLGAGDDGEIGDRRDLPVFARVDAGDAAAGFRIADHAGAVIDQFTDVDRVAQDAVAAHRIAVDRADVPALSSRPRHAFRIQAAGDGQRRFPIQIFAIDAADNFCLVFVDFAQAAFGFAARVQFVDLAIAVDDIAGHASAGDPARLAAPDLVGQILAEQAGHCALEADLQFVDRAFGQGDDARARELDPLVDIGKVFLIAREAVDRLCQHHFRLAGGDVFDQGVEAGAVPHRAADGIVGKDLRDRPTFALCPL